ncbi:MAG TPA: hypothetical protein VLK58_04075 [Conexibacter sp.]|nr:hypothetical protein [Conexibacter sp.]
MSFHRPARRAAASLLGASALAVALLPAAPAVADVPVSISSSPKVVKVNQSVTVTARARPIRDIYRDHAVSVFVLRPGVACPVDPPLHDDWTVLGSVFYWSFLADVQPRPTKVLIERPSAVGVAEICTYVRGDSGTGLTVDAPAGPGATVRIAASPRAWDAIVRVVSTRLQERDGRVPVRVACAEDAPPPCSGRVRLRSGRTILGEREFRIAPGRTLAVSVAIERRPSRQLSVDLIPARGVVVTRRVPLGGAGLT